MEKVLNKVLLCTLSLVGLIIYAIAGFCLGWLIRGGNSFQEEIIPAIILTLIYAAAFYYKKIGTKFIFFNAFTFIVSLVLFSGLIYPFSAA